MELHRILSYLAGFKSCRAPGQIVIQLTDRCNALCPQCGMRATESFERHRLGLDEARRILDAAAQRNIEVVSFTGGEPLLFPRDLLMLIKHAGSLGIKYIRTGTNGYLFSNPHRPLFQPRIERIAKALSETPLRNFWISIDSAFPSVHETMRGLPGVVKGIERALPTFHAYGVYPSANLGINRNVGGVETRSLRRSSFGSDEEYLEEFHRTFKKAFRQFFRFVVDLGFTMVSACYPMSIRENDSQMKAVYGASSTDLLIRFNRAEKEQLFKALLETTTEFRSLIRVFSPRSSLHGLCRQYAREASKGYPCRGGIDYFFVDAREGNTYPCGYRGEENLGKLWSLGEGEPSSKNGSGCYRCDWECFRDPSELFGPFIQGLSDPCGLLRKLKGDRPFLGLWLDDLRYYHACGLFDGRMPPDYGKLRRFRP